MHLPINHRETETTCSEKWNSAFNRTPVGTILTRYHVSCSDVGALIKKHNIYRLAFPAVTTISGLQIKSPPR